MLAPQALLRDSSLPDWVKATMLGQFTPVYSVQEKTVEELEEEAYQEIKRLKAADSIIMVDPLLKIMAQTGSVRVQEAGCRVLRKLCVGDAADNRIKAGEMGGVEMVVAGMVSHLSNAGMQEVGCGTLRNLTSGCPENKAKVVQLGGLEAVLKGLREHIQDSLVAEAAAGALANFSTELDVAKRIKAAGGVELMRQVLTVHADSSKVRKYGERMLECCDMV